MKDAMRIGYENYQVVSIVPARIRLTGLRLAASRVIRLQHAHRDLVEQARPGYALQVARYLEDGHTGLAIVEDESIVAMGWMYANRSTRRIHATYYPLNPGTAWLHADWTAPERRRRGLHTQLVVARVEHLARSNEVRLVEANIGMYNTASYRSYRRCGFTDAGRLAVVKLGPMKWAWRTAVR